MVIYIKIKVRDPIKYLKIHFFLNFDANNVRYKYLFSIIYKYFSKKNMNTIGI